MYDTIPGMVLNIHVKSIAIQGLKSLQLLTGSSIDVDKIEIESPQVILDKLASSDTTKKVANDSVALYKLLLGHFNFIRAKSISVNNASFKLNDKIKNSFTSLGNLSILIADFNIDKDHDYKQLLGYFVKNAVVNLRQFKIIDSAAKSIFALDSLQYNSFKKQLFFYGIQQEKQKVHLITFEGLNTSDFVYQKLFNSRNLTIKNGTVVLEGKASSVSGEDNLFLSVDNMLTGVKVDTILLQNVNVSVKVDGKETMNVTGINSTIPNFNIDSNSTPIKKYLPKKNIQFSFKKAFVHPLDGLHYVELWDLAYNSKNKLLSIEKLHLEPQYPKDEAMKKLGHPTDLFFVDAKKITLNDCNIFDMFLNNSIAASSVNATINFKVYDDNTIPNPNANKPSDYPQKKIGEAKIDINIPVINLANSTVIYEEKSSGTRLVSQVIFNNVNAQIKNVHNRQNLSQPLLVDIQAKFMNASKFITHWSLPYGTQSFNINGSLGSMDLLLVNNIARGMGSVNIKQGQLNAFSFDVNGDNKNANGKVMAQYNNIKIELLKRDDKTGELEKKELESLIGNILLHKNNTSATPKEYNYKPRVGDSFFGTAWSSIFAGLKKIAM